MEPHSLAPGKLDYGVFKNIPLGKCTSTLLVAPPLIDCPTRPYERPPIEGGNSAPAEAAVPPPEVATPNLPPFEVTSTAVPPEFTVLEEASFEMAPSILESIEISLLPAKVKTLDSRAKAWLRPVITVPASTPRVVPIAPKSAPRVPSSAPTSEPIAMPATNPMVVP
jgi:hypothetical protein